MDHDNGDLLRPLLSPPATASFPSSSTIVSRISFVLFIGAVSVWANHESSKGFAVKVINEAGDTAAGKRFRLFYEANDEATRTLFRATAIVDGILYSDLDSRARKPLNAVTLKLKSEPADVVVAVESDSNGEFVINLSASILEGERSNRAVFSAVLRGVTRIRLWDGQGRAPRTLVAGIVEYVASVPSFIRAAEKPQTGAAEWWMEEDPPLLAEFLSFVEGRRRGFVAKLNAAMKDGWENGALLMCRSYALATYNSSSV